MEFTFLGTGAGMPAKQRNVSSLAVSFPEYSGETWLFDCGEGTQHQVLYTSVKLTRLKVVLITHLHGDHIYGLPGVLGSRSFQGAEDELVVIGPRAGIGFFIKTSLSVSGTYLKYPLVIHEFEEDGTVYEDDHFIVEAKALDHGILSFGYRIIEKDQPGELLVEKLKQLGIRPGPIYQEIKTKSHVTLPDGQVLESAPFLGEKKKGRRFAVIGDTRPCQAAIALADHADLLIHEATFSKEMEKRRRMIIIIQRRFKRPKFKAASAAALIMTHISSRYQKEDEARLLDEAKSIYPSVQLAHDRWTFHLNRQPR
ncbi:ribonuclease Z [Terrilactibacillus sp. S3-3]|nr:ribonuclease Z [Terrilactibacillus sp. S3-3]